MSEPRAGIALGSNLGDRLARLQEARNAIVHLPHARPPMRQSFLYETAPVGCEPGAGPFYNAVVEIGYVGAPQELWVNLREIEAALGRPAVHARNVSRPIDLDLLYFGDVHLEGSPLQLPHPRMTSRAFVMRPLADVAGDLQLPGETRTVREISSALDEAGVLRCATRNW